MASRQQPARGPAQSSHMLKTGKRGNPFCKDLHDLFGTLMVALRMRTISRFFRTYSNAFTTDDAMANLNSLRFSQSNRMADPADPMRIITTTTTTTFTMTRDIAMSICQHFMNARLIRNAADPSAVSFKDRGIYQMTPKGLHLLEKFIEKNGMAADQFAGLFQAEPMALKLIYLDRRPADDEIQLTRKDIYIVWIKFAGKKRTLAQQASSGPVDRRKNAVGLSRPTAAKATHHQPSYGAGLGSFDNVVPIDVDEVSDRDPVTGRDVHSHVFDSLGALDWLCNLTTCCCREECAEIMAHFVRCGLIRPLRPSDEVNERFFNVEVRVPPPVQVPEKETAKYVYDSKVKYAITDEGKWRAGWEGSREPVYPAGPKVSSSDRSFDDSSSAKGAQLDGGEVAVGSALPASTTPSGEEKDSSSLSAKDSVSIGIGGPGFHVEHSSTQRLRVILDDPVARNLFSDFLKANYCDENLTFWRSVEEFRRRFATTSSAMGASSASGRPAPASNASSNAMEAHQQELVNIAHSIYYRHLQPSAPSELNIDHALRTEVTHAVGRYLFPGGMPRGQPGVPVAMPESFVVPEHQTRATHIQSLLTQYERVQDHIFRLLASDQLPRFMATERWKSYREESGLA